MTLNWKKKRLKSKSRKIRDTEVDYSDIPELSDEQLAKFKRRGRPVIGDTPRKAISIRIDESVLKKLKSKEKQMTHLYTEDKYRWV